MEGKAAKTAGGGQIRRKRPKQAVEKAKRIPTKTGDLYRSAGVVRDNCCAPGRGVVVRYCAGEGNFCRGPENVRGKNCGNVFYHIGV
jgi:hypothetical protein